MQAWQSDAVFPLAFVPNPSPWVSIVRSPCPPFSLLGSFNFPCSSGKSSFLSCFKVKIRTLLAAFVCTHPTLCVGLLGMISLFMLESSSPSPQGRVNQKQNPLAQKFDSCGWIRHRHNMHRCSRFYLAVLWFPDKRRHTQHADWTQCVHLERQPRNATKRTETIIANKVCRGSSSLGQNV